MEMTLPRLQRDVCRVGPRDRETRTLNPAEGDVVHVHWAADAILPELNGCRYPSVDEARERHETTQVHHPSRRRRGNPAGTEGARLRHSRFQRAEDGFRPVPRLIGRTA